MAGPFKVIGLDSVRETLTQWKAEFSSAAYAQILEAMKTMAGRLEQSPEECGEPERNIYPNGVVHTAFQHPLIFKFAAYRDHKRVVIKRIQLMNWTRED